MQVERYIHYYNWRTLTLNRDWSFYHGKQCESQSVRHFDRNRSSSERDLASIVYAKPNKDGTRNDAYTRRHDQHQRPITQGMVRVLPDDHAPSQRHPNFPAYADNAGFGRRMSEPAPDFYDRYEPAPDYGPPDSPRTSHRMSDRPRGNYLVYVF